MDDVIEPPIQQASSQVYCHPEDPLMTLSETEDMIVSCLEHKL